MTLSAFGAKSCSPVADGNRRIIILQVAGDAVGWSARKPEGGVAGGASSITMLALQRKRGGVMIKVQGENHRRPRRRGMAIGARLPHRSMRGVLGASNAGEGHKQEHELLHEREAPAANSPIHSLSLQHRSNGPTI